MASENKGVLVFAEDVGGKMASIALEALGGGRTIANALGEELMAVIIGSGISGEARQAIAYGADKAYVVDDHQLKDYQTDSYVAVMEKVCKKVMPRLVIMGQTSVGRDLAARLAFRLGTTFSPDCIELAVETNTKRILQTRPVYGGNARAVFTSDTFPQIATIRPKVMPCPERDSARQGEVIALDTGLKPGDVRTRVLNKVKQEVEGIKLEDAAVVVSGGRGMGSGESFKQLDELARMLKGATGASRPPCDSGWVPTTIQVGLTGKTVTPELYIAVGLSGSSQHMAGCSGAKAIVAINKDPEANIFKEACFGVVGDWKQVLPAFSKKVKELLAG